ncbi:hypothetical protein FO519_006158 [Halicephalobus sp. NKZ332]|nr:hypothetical protein FO519_006158 [Halicephalobus sp. NKZ332]
MLKLFLSLLIINFASGELVGGISEFDLHENSDSEFYSYLVDESLRRINFESKDHRHWKLDRIFSSSKQVVNGIKYRLSFVTVQTQCNKQNDKERIELKLCSVRDDAPKQLCQSEVLVKAWESSQEFVNKGCSHFEEKEKKVENNVQGRNESLSKVIDTQAETIFRISKHIKPKDFGVWNLFTGFMDRHKKQYESKKEILRRFRVYKRNTRAAKVLQKQELGTAVYGETQFMDLTADEFRKIYLPYTWESPSFPVKKLDPEDIEDDDIPDAFDWRSKDVVTPVKNQGSCGSCWAFSVTGNIEGQWAKKTGKLVSLSEQELVDCDVIDQGCNGGLPLNAYKEIIRMGGLEPENEYPYDGHKESCHLARKDIAVYINDSVQLPPDEKKMAIWLFKNGPISVEDRVLLKNGGTCPEEKTRVSLGEEEKVPQEVKLLRR